MICVVCGVQYAETGGIPTRCLICEDERQWVPRAGQKWTTVEVLRDSHHNRLQVVEPNLISIRTEPTFGIGQQAYLIQTKQGNVLWDCISLIDAATIEAIKALGGISAIAISHPHFYSSMVEWSRAFNNAPIYLHAADRTYAMNLAPSITFWEGDTLTVAEGITLVHCGGHFEGSTALHWADGAEGKGVLLSSDTIMVVPDTRYVSFMYSYPNLIPLSEQAIRKIMKALDPFVFDRIYSSWPDHVCLQNGKHAIRISAERYFSHR